MPIPVPVETEEPATVIKPKPRVEGPAVAAVVEVRRLTPSELDATLQMLVGDRSGVAAELMPGIDGDRTEYPFDNDYTVQAASTTWVESAERVVNKVVAETLASATRKAAILPCTPTGNSDTACLKKFIASFGRKVLRRPLLDDEITQLTSLHALALQRGDFTTSMSLVMRRLLLDPEFLFRIEIGEPKANGAIALGRYELASRLSFFLLGRGPDEALLNTAEAGGLSTPAGVRDAARKMLDSEEGRAQVQAFHAMWFGYRTMPYDPAFIERADTETSALIRKVIFEDRGDYRNLFTSTRTYIDDTMAQHYGLQPTGVEGKHWVEYGASGRMGILSHASLLSNGAKSADTSPTLRGKWIRKRLFCQEIPKPPPNVVADVPPPSEGNLVCKKDRYAVHSSGGCLNCHKFMDPIGFGLEQYDRMGKHRTAEADFPECQISGDGELDGVGKFNGPKQLADLMIANDVIDNCVPRHLFRFGAGRYEDESDEPLLRDLTDAFVQNGRRFDDLILDYVSHPTFAERREAL